ncbi:hypothetical protein GLOIN_2v1779083 [Rhizophagus irregularis DAOM 181602=DAOM 197198]|uniref:F-box domain-containing protein n=1 Tax=Rhizophagus irregularis (strain DAOM 197198w) TaxID=1432141 RepID=A0A015LKS3_RHIIW|nr:hypothetical protein RirG_225920 [Rhizophagus irregularis DAOM 197198w]GBC47865.2 hypothetical protein GLOIN_2v1779083 [Rhizophagus irregularis DAOM 181602=DAOM 197198]
MACSKICSGDLPELINEVIQYFRYDYKTLHSCILVNRLWCHLAIPLLWEDPFSNPTKNYHFIEIYLCFLNEDGKAKFNEYGINNLLLSNKLFNYPSFIKYLNTNKICNSIKYWVDTLMDKYDDNLKNLVYRSLFEVFIENEGSLHSFEAVLSIGNSCNYFSNNMDLILQNPNLINNIRGLTFRGFEVFDHLNVLESIHLIYCEYLNSDSIQQIIKVTKPFKLKTLIMSEIIHIESLLLLLQKFGDCLENFGFGNIDEIIDEYNEPKRQLFEFITKYCKKIRYFESGLPDDNNTYLFIKNNQHNINYLTIEADFHDHYAVYNVSSTVLRNLGQVLPSKLEYLCLTLIFTTNDLEIFLKNSQNTFIKKLLIKQIIVDEDENIDISFYIKKYIMKKERVKYLAILKEDFDDKELFFLKDEVNEFKLHNIVVQKYNNLHIDTYSYVNNYLQY